MAHKISNAVKLLKYRYVTCNKYITLVGLGLQSAPQSGGKVLHGTIIGTRERGENY